MKLKILLLILIVNIGIASGQSSILNDSCICYTDQQDIKCLECLVKSPLKDSLISEYKHLNVQADSVINIVNNRLQLYSDSLRASKQSITLCKDKRKRTLRNGIKASFISLFIGFIVGFLI